MFNLNFDTTSKQQLIQFYKAVKMASALLPGNNQTAKKAAMLADQVIAELKTENPDKSEMISPPTEVGDLHRYLMRARCYTLPRIRMLESGGKKKIDVSGGAVFDGENDKLKGFLSAEETAEAFNISIATLHRELRLAKAWLLKAMKPRLL